MARFLCEPIKLQQIDDYFKLGTDIDMKVFPASTLQGKPFDPTTGIDSLKCVTFPSAWNTDVDLSVIRDNSVDFFRESY